MSSGRLETKKSGDFYWSKDDVRHVVHPTSRARARPRRVVRPTASLPAARAATSLFARSRPSEVIPPSPCDLAASPVDVRPLTLNSAPHLPRPRRVPRRSPTRSEAEGDPREVPADQGAVRSRLDHLPADLRRRARIQLAVACWMGKNASTPVLILCAYVFGGFATANLFLANHELSHNLAFKSPGANRAARSRRQSSHRHPLLGGVQEVPP